ncbi:unnamed protein product [Arabis nemorensis]|uniref:K-box domain-containing protein n=1 Tax=Arabis nemorensis TaxID=586526 RepID=A0A565BCB1_9BRAS|nr:unnamed protein product [Arabis nemorensis]
MEVEEDEKTGLGIGMKRQVLVPCKISSSISSGERQDAGVVLSKIRVEFERQSAESMEIKFERLWLLKERLNARELDGMTSAQLRLLEDQIYQALRGLHEHKFSPRQEQMLKKRKEVMTS